MPSQVEILSDDTCNFPYFRTSCACSDPGHTMELIIDYHKDEGRPDIILNLYSNLSWDDYNWYKSNILSKMWHRLKAAVRIVFTGYIEVNEEFMFRGEKQVRELSDTLLSCLTQLENIKNIKS